MQHYLTYQHNVQRLFRDHAEKYDGVIVPLSIATSFPGGTYGFVRALCAADSEKRYAVDPRNAMFQKAWNRSNVRKPHEKMAATFGAPYEAALRRPLRPGDFTSESLIGEHVRRCLSEQRRFGKRDEDARKLEKYRKLLGIDVLGDLGPPQFLIPPYYQFTDLDDAWYAISAQCVATAMQQRKEGESVRPVLHFRDWETPDWTSCLGQVADEGVVEIWLYPNFFKEHEATLTELNGYRSTVSRAVGAGLRPFSLFGGYYAILMSYFGLRGFSNGVGYGEWRDSGYHRGGTATTRVYMLKLHRYVDAPDAQHLAAADPDYFGNDTEITGGYTDAGDSLVEMTLAESLDHFLDCRKQELEFVESQSIETAVAELKETRKRLEAIGSLEGEKYGASLQRWSEAIVAE